MVVAVRLKRGSFFFLALSASRIVPVFFLCVSYLLITPKREIIKRRREIQIETRENNSGGGETFFKILVFLLDDHTHKHTQRERE